MRIFFVTDNKRWFEFLEAWQKDRPEDVVIYCSPTGAEFFSEEIMSGRVFELDVKSDFSKILADFDIGFSCHCKQIFPKELVENLPCFNFHPGFNPYNRGWFPQVFSIINGKPAGATVHKMDDKVDHGPVIDRINVKIYDWDTSKSVYDRVLQAEFDLFEKWIDRLLKGDFNEDELESVGNYNSISDFKNLCEVDLKKKVTFKEAIDYFRAMTFTGYDNAFFYDREGRKVYVSLNIKVER